jgi:hypothetical protein
LSELQLLAVEYSRSVVRLPLSIGERIACLITIPTRMLGRHGRIKLGRWRRHLTSKLRPAGRS